MICVDASVAMKWFIDEEHLVQARTLLETSASVGEAMIAPPLLPSEITNALRQRVRRGQMEVEDAQGALSEFLAYPIELLAPQNLFGRALAISVDFGLPATYDAQYVALSEMLGAPFWTADRRLFNATASRMPFVRWIGDYPG